MRDEGLTQRIPKMWGREIILHNAEYCCKLLQYDGVRTSSEHYHEKKHETFVIVKGYFEIERYPKDQPYPRIKAVYGPGAAIVLPPGTVHKLTCMTPEGGLIVEASTHDDPSDCVRIAPSVNPFGK
jgi:mannose-6-phosphate isomerase-like protein (cupin superfamily)